MDAQANGRPAQSASAAIVHDTQAGAPSAERVHPVAAPRTSATGTPADTTKRDTSERLLQP
ncbi:hypothetical protein AB0D38_28860 [Streptomyces sp. NPDC048279]|uniref:hypothetical protein n=1 Tax=Streptomyces sp. NPDC048279 TaxID=3154714 RepID=UPI003448AF22